MLTSLDILIGFSVIMLVVSMAVTLINQWILTLLQMRGKKLKDGITTLLSQIAPDLLTKEHATTIAERVLMHPLAGRGGQRLAEVTPMSKRVAPGRGFSASASAGSSSEV